MQDSKSTRGLKVVLDEDCESTQESSYQSCCLHAGGGALSCGSENGGEGGDGHMLWRRRGTIVRLADYIEG